MIRTHPAGELRAEHAGTQVVLAGWVARRRDHGGVIFIDLRDASGVVQVVFREGAPGDPLSVAAHDLRAEYCIGLEGVVAVRPAGNENLELATGGIDVSATALEVLSTADPLPFPVEAAPGEGAEISEEARLRWRYLDLRRPGPARALRLRAHATRVIRSVMDAHGFLDIETPYLTRSTPEGARDFLVPVRLQPGSWYALPQSPQLFKQLLMVAGLERYYQIARCFRDEDFRADRQPEFTQLDVEMSFLTEQDIYALTEELLARVWAEVLSVQVPTPFPRLSYAEAMARYGVDRPDTRFGVELTDLTTALAGTEYRVFATAIEAGGYVGAVVMPGGAAQTRKELDGWQEWARSRGARGLAYVVLDAETGQARGPVAKNLAAAQLAAVATATGAQPGDAVFFAAAPVRADALALLGAARLEIGARCGLIDASAWNFTWITDFPMFEPTADGGWTAVHHPFTAPATADEADFHLRPGEALSRAYDVVVNGQEIGGGSIRIYRAEMQQRVFDVIGLSAAEAQAQFGFLLEAFRYGPPPHGGIAFGLDRLCQRLADADSIREVIAFPKTASGGDPLTGAPAPITAAQRREAGIDAVPSNPA